MILKELKKEIDKTIEKNIIVKKTFLEKLKILQENSIKINERIQKRISK